MRVFQSTDMIRSCTNRVQALQIIVPMGELGDFNILKQLSRGKNQTRKKTTIELCDGDTNIVVFESRKGKICS